MYTFPDNTDNHLHFVNLRASHAFTDALLLAGNAYYRGYRRATLNGDTEVQCVDEDDSEIALALGLCEGSAAPFGGVGELGLEVEGEDRTTETDTDGYGGTLQLSRQAMFFGARTASPSVLPMTETIRNSLRKRPRRSCFVGPGPRRPAHR